MFCGGLFSPLRIQVVVTTSFLVVFPLVSISRLLRLVVVVVVDCSSSVYL